VGGSGILCNAFTRGIPSAVGGHLGLPSGPSRV